MITLSPDTALLLVIASAVGTAMAVLGARWALLELRVVRCPACGHTRLGGSCVRCRNR